MATIPAGYRDLFERESFANLATVMPDGTPQVTPVWIDYDGEHVLVNTAEGRQKERNVRSNPRVGLVVLDPEDPYRYVSIRGEVAEITQDGAVEHIHELTRRYMNVERYPNLEEEDGPRVLLRIKPERVVTSG